MQLMITSKEIKMILSEMNNISIVAKIQFKLLSSKELIKKIIKNYENTLAINIEVYGDYEGMVMHIDPEFMSDMIVAYGGIISSLILSAMTAKTTFENIVEHWTIQKEKT